MTEIVAKMYFGRKSLFRFVRDLIMNRVAEFAYLEFVPKEGYFRLI